MFYVICAAIGVAVLMIVLRPVWHDANDGPSGAQDIDLYRAQLDDLARDVEKGTLPEAEAERARTEIARRILAADKTAPTVMKTAPKATSRGLALGAGALLLAGAAGGYAYLGAPGLGDLPRADRIAAAETARETRMSQAEAAGVIAPPPARRAPTEETIAMVEQLRTAMETRPDELRGHQFLAEYEAELGNFDAAIDAQRDVIRIKGADATEADKLFLVDLMVYRLRGYVSPEAEEIARDIVKTSPGNIGARYYIGLMHDTTGRPDIAFGIWRELVESGASDPHIGLAQRAIQNAADRAGIRYEQQTTPGPSAADMAAAADMSPEDREQMIRGMVEGLNERLATQGGPAGDWARLITALAALGETERATAILQEAEARFGARDVDAGIIADAAKAAGLR